MLGLSERMYLSDAEQKLVEQLQKRQRSLIRWRWAGLLGALTYIGASCYGIVVVDHFLDEPDPVSVIIVAFLIPTIYLLVCTGAGLMVYVCLRWNGKPETYLLLRLVEESRDDAAKQVAGGSRS